MAAGVLALDLASATGWAYGRLPAQPLTPLEAAVAKPPQPLSGVARFGGELGPFLDAFDRWLGDTFDRHRPGGVIFESPILPAKTNPSTVRKLMGLADLVHLAAHRRRIPWIREAQPSTVKLFICGNGGPGKEGVKAAIRSFGWSYEDDNEADALALHCYAADLYAAERARAA